MNTTDADTIGGRGTDRVPMPLSVAIVDAVTTQENISEKELDPLYEFIDPDALDSLFLPRSAGTDRSIGSVRFHYNGYWVTVTADPEIEIEVVKR